QPSQGTQPSQGEAFYSPQSASGASGGSGGYGAQAFDSIYEGVLNALALEESDYAGMDEEELFALFSGMLRPAFDRAIADRLLQGNAEQGELAADANARGMANSSHAAEASEDAAEAVTDDIALLEESYATRIAERMYAALRAQRAAASAQSGHGASDAAAAPSSDGFQAAAEYMNSLPARLRHALLYSGEERWREMREQLIAAYGRDVYDRLVRHFGNGRPGASPHYEQLLN
ncbi:MAG: hypothetical protein Q4B99_02175, partial [Clostridia bacterium]|nr:hypothetical protein [Clostridia bacterium]